MYASIKKDCVYLTTIVINQPSIMPVIKHIHLLMNGFVHVGSFQRCMK